jgi:ABC-2 type transport system ATP-binding protein
MYIKKIRHIYDNFTLDIEDVELCPNKIIGLVGENGAGKTTLMNILSGYQQANAHFDTEGLERNAVLYIPSDLEPYSYLTVGEFIEIVAENNPTSMTPASLLTLLSLEDKEETIIEDLSQGMRKKLALINLFVTKNELIILDEPFNSIDMKYVHELKKWLSEMKEQSTILISSHILDTLSNLCDEFVYLQKGEVTKIIENKDANSLERELFG